MRGWGLSVLALVCTGWLAGAELVPIRSVTPLPAPPHDVPCNALPINLPTALSLAGARSLDVAVASERINLAAAQLQRARRLWLPSIYWGGDYFRHDGQIQNVEGRVFGTSKSSLMAGAGPVAVFSFSDALFAPLAARQVVRAREATLQAAQNDTTLAVAEAYFLVQQARGELAGLEDAAKRAEELVTKTEKLVGAGLVSSVEVSRVRAETARRRQAVHSARERGQVAGADLARILRLDVSTVVEPQEPPDLQITLVDPGHTVADLVPIALTNRPELAAQQSIVRSALEQLQQERWRPLVPSLLLRGASTNPAGIMAAGTFGGGLNSRIGDFHARSDFDIQLLWQLEGLGLSNRARVNERRAENELARLELLRVQDQVASEVAQVYARSESARARVAEAEAGLRDAVDSANKNVEALGQTQMVGGRMLLIVRPQEVIDSLRSLAQAHSDYAGAVADYDRAQFQLYRALGHPAQDLAGLACGDAAGALSH